MLSIEVEIIYFFVFVKFTIAKIKEQKKENRRMEDYELTERDNMALEELFKSDLELQKLLKKRVFVQNKLE